MYDYYESPVYEAGYNDCLEEHGFEFALLVDVKDIYRQFLDRKINFDTASMRLMRAMKDYYEREEE